jgi:hypothetical protein
VQSERETLLGSCVRAAGAEANDAPTADRRSVAIVAVHGVGSPEPGNTARSIADLLGAAAGVSFVERPLRIPESIPPDVQARARALADPSTEPPVLSRIKGNFRRRIRLDVNERPTSGVPIDIALSAEHVARYEPPQHARTYSTSRLSADRVGSRSVDIYEFYWADLSKSAPSVLGALSKFVALPQHLMTIARRSIAYADGDRLAPRRWDLLALFLYVLRFLLIILIPVLNAVYLGVASAHLLTRLPPWTQPLVAAFLPALAAFCLLARLSYRTAPAWALLPAFDANVLFSLALGVGAFVVLRALPSPQDQTWSVLLATEWFAAVTMVLWLVVEQTEIRIELRRTVFAVCAGAAAIYAGGHAWHLLATRAPEGAVGRLAGTVGNAADPVLTTCDALLLALAVAWLSALIVALFFVAVAPTTWLPDYVRAWVGRPREEAAPGARKRSRLAADTASVGVAAAILGIEVVQMIYLRGVTNAAFEHAVAKPPGTLNQVPMGTSALLAMTSGVPLVGVAFLVCALVLTLYVLVPSIAWEVAGSAPVEEAGEPPPLPSDESPADKEREQRAGTPEASTRLGDWLDRGLRLIRYLVPIFVLSAVFAPMIASGVIASVDVAANEAFAAAQDEAKRAQADGKSEADGADRAALDMASAKAKQARASRLSRLVDKAWGAAATLALALTAWLLRSPSSIRSLWPVVGIIFDIDAYLTELPENGTPRARMVERLLALLNEVRRGGYAKLVLVSHSQGTVITCDALRLFKEICGAPSPPIELVTMGCPLDAIYATFLPHLYDWVPRMALEEGKLGERGPELAPLGVRSWTNLYRSGDYIGRNLWPWPHGQNAFAVGGNPAARPPAAEACLGAGAHMGYWRDPVVGARLLALVAREPHLAAPSFVPSGEALAIPKAG